MMLRDKSISKFYAFALAAVFALTLAGCGGGGTAAMDPDPPVVDPGPTAEEIAAEAEEIAAEATALQAAKGAASAAAMAAYAALGSAKAAVNGASGDQDHDAVHYALAQTELGKAKDAYQAAQAASDAAQAAGASADAQMYQAQAEAAQERAEAALAEATTFANAVTAMGDAARTAATEAAATAAAETAEALALSNAQAAAMSAAGMASAASMAAADAVSAVADQAGDDAASYAAAQAAATAAANASAAAAAANTAAAGATSSADAQMYQEQAETAQGDSATAQANAEMYAGMVTSSYNAAEAIRQANATEEMALANAKSAAMSAAQMARAAATAAATAVANVTANQGADQGSYASAQAQAAAADAAARAAEAANISAQGTTASGSAQLAQGLAETAQANAMTARDNAVIYAGMVTAAHDTAEENRLAMEQEVRDLADAKSDASDAAGAARMAANEAAAEAAAGAMLGDSLTQAKIAEAEAAAVAADNASAAADMAENSADAQMYRDTAQEEQGNAEAAKMAAVTASAEAVRIAGIDNPDEAIEIVAARAAANAAAQNAKVAMAAAQAAKEAAPGDTAAAAAAQAAEDAYMAAKMAAETADAATTLQDATDAKTLAESHATDAETARAAAVLASNRAIAFAAVLDDAKTNARPAVMDAMGAADDADGAVTSADNAASLAASDAEQARTNAAGVATAQEAVDKARMDAEAARAKAQGASDAINAATTTLMVAEAKANAEQAEKDAEAAKMAATVAETAAETAAMTHVLELLMAANAYHVTAMDINLPDEMDAEDNPIVFDESADGEVNENQDMMKATYVGKVATAIATAVAAAAPAATVAIEYNPDGKEDGATTIEPMIVDDDDNPVPSVREITATIDSENLVSFGDPNNQSGVDLPMLHGWYGVELEDQTAGAETDDVTTDDRTLYAHIYTNIEQDTEDVTSIMKTTVTEDATERMITDPNDAESTVPGPGLGNPANSPGDIDATVSLSLPHGDSFMGSFDTNGATDGGVREGEFVCPDNTCTFVTDGDGKITSVVGYRFYADEVTTETTTTTVTQNETDYLAIGVWLHAPGDRNTGADTEAGVFATGNDEVTVPLTLTVLTGSASYRGPATGVHTDGSSVDFFQGTANLTANFGDTPDDDTEDGVPVADTAPGTISGSIDNIKTGNGRTNQPPHDSIQLGEAAIAPDMNGIAVMGPPVVNDPRMPATYSYTGRWDASFFGNNPDADAMTDDGTSDIVKQRGAYPDSVAGTFGVTGSEGEGDDPVTHSFIGAFGAHKQ